MVGRCGSGKSSVINNIIGEDLALVTSLNCESTMPFHVDKKLLINSTQYHCHITEIPDITCKESKPVSHYINDIAKTKRRINLEKLNLIIYVTRGSSRVTREDNEIYQRYADFFNNAHSISAVVITNCDGKNNAAQARVVEVFKHCLCIATSMGKGVYTAGCPDLNEVYIESQEMYKQKRQKTMTKLHQLIEESCDVVDVLKVNNGLYIRNLCNVM